MKKKKELNSSKSKGKKTICGLTVLDVVIFVLLGIFHMKTAFVYLVIISSIRITASIRRERRECMEEAEKHKRKIPFYDNSNPRG